MDIAIVAAAFKGIQICVVYLIASAGFKMLKKMKKTPLNIAAFSVRAIIAPQHIMRTKVKLFFEYQGCKELLESGEEIF